MGSLKDFSAELTAQIKGRFTAAVYTRGLQSDSRPREKLEKGLKEQGYSFAQGGGWSTATPPFPQKGDDVIYPTALRRMKPDQRASAVDAFKKACIQAFRSNADQEASPPTQEL